MVVASAIALVGCSDGVGPSSDQVYERGREVNLTFKRAVADVQKQLTEDPWDASQYGNAPDDCGNGHLFQLVRTTPVGWVGFGGDERAAAERLGNWLSAQGWSEVSLRTYEGEITNVVLQARREDAHVDRLDVDFKSGTAADVVILSASSTCEPGDADALMKELYPGWPTNTVKHEPLPTEEAPGDTPIFGFASDGKPRTS